MMIKNILVQLILGSVLIGISHLKAQETNIIDNTTVITNGLYYVGNNTTDSLLVITNNGKLFVTNNGSSIGYTSANVTTIITDPGSQYNNVGNLNVGELASEGKLIVKNQGYLSSGGLFVSIFGLSNSVLVRDPGTVVDITGSTYVGYWNGGNYNSLTVSNQAQFNTSSVRMGNTTSSSNLLLVTDAGSLFNNSGVNITIGDGSVRNELIVSNGAVLVDTGATIISDYYGSNNRMIVTAGAIVTNGGMLVGKLSGQSNELTISDGAKMVTLGDATVGYFSIGTNQDHATITGAGSTWTVTGNLTAGAVGGSGNSVIASNAGNVFVTGNIDVGVSGATDNSIKIAGAASKIVNTNAAGLAITTVGDGTLDMQGGTFLGNTVKTDRTTSLIKGFGTIDADVKILNGGTISPGTVPGTSSLNLRSLDMGSNGNYDVEINSFSGTAGALVGWDYLNVSSSLIVSATNSNPFNIKVRSLTLGNTSGDASGFNQFQNYSIAIAGAQNIAGFDTNKFNLDLTAFSNDYSLGGGSWFLSQNNNNLYLNYQIMPVPEPGSWFMLIAGFLMVVVICLRRRGLKQIAGLLQSSKYWFAILVAICCVPSLLKAQELDEIADNTMNELRSFQHDSLVSKGAHREEDSAKTKSKDEIDQTYKGGNPVKENASLSKQTEPALSEKDSAMLK